MKTKWLSAAATLMAALSAALLSYRSELSDTNARAAIAALAGLCIALFFKFSKKWEERYRSGKAD